MTGRARVAVVTGAASGIGRAVASRLARDGDLVCLCDIDVETAGRLAEEQAAEGRRASAVAMDVREPRSVERGFEEARQRFGPVEVLACCAGIPGHGELSGLEDERWEQVIAVNLDGVFHCMREALRQMLPLKRGIIVNISSMCGLMGCASSPAYSAAKAGVIGLSRSCARRHAAEGIRVNVVAPGLVDTPFVEPDRRMGKLEAGIAKIPIGRMGTAEEIADLVAYLCSDPAAFLVGQVISPNGGQLI